MPRKIQVSDSSHGLRGWQLAWTVCLAAAIAGCNRTPPAPPAGPSATGTSTTGSITVPGIANGDVGTQQAAFEAKPFEMPRVENPGYVGYQQCLPCHKSRVEECLPSSHFQTCRLPTAERMPRAVFSSDANERTLKLPGSAVTFEVYQRDGRYWQAAVDGRSGQRIESTIDLVYGAKSTTDEVYLSWHPDESMWELPVAWVWSHDCWGAAGFDRQSSGNFSRELTVRCFECHNTWFEHEPGTLSTYRRNDSLLMGVTCERCHGPGKQHVEHHLAHPNDKQAHAIVYPGGLERERLIEVCTQCHSNSIRHRGPALAYRPGAKLDDYYRTVHPAHGEDDHVANQVPHLRASQCFQHSQMTCITCHDPHLTASAPHGMTFQDACIQCHARQACKERPELPAPIADNCTGCHMRRYAKINVNFDLADDAYVPPLERSQHRIAVDPVGTQEVLYRWYAEQTDDRSRELAAESKEWLLEHWFRDGQQRSDEGRYTAAIASMREILRLDSNHGPAQSKLREYAQSQRALDDLIAQAEHARRSGSDRQAIELYEQVLKVRPDNAQAMGRLGATYAKIGERAKGEQLLRRSAEIDPDEQYGLSMLAWLALGDKKYAEAARLYAEANAREPFNSKLNYLWGMALLRSGEADRGIERLLVALESDPRNLDAARGIALAYLQRQQPDKALPWCERAAQLTNYQSQPDLQLLSECQAAQ